MFENKKSPLPIVCTHLLNCYVAFAPLREGLLPTKHAERENEYVGGNQPFY